MFKRACKHFTSEPVEPTVKFLVNVTPTQAAGEEDDEGCNVCNCAIKALICACNSATVIAPTDTGAINEATIVAATVAFIIVCLIFIVLMCFF